jgi:hypothetical protein
MRDQVTEADVGTPVVHDGERVGKVVDYENETAFVDPAPGVVETVAAKLDVDDSDHRVRPLEPELVEAVTDDEIRLRTEL